MTINDRIAALRKEQGMSQEEFGDMLGVSRQSVSKWESGQSVPEVENLAAMSRLFGVSVGWLLGTESEPRPEAEFSETQLKMVEEIAAKYIAALPGDTPEPSADDLRWKKRRKWLAALAIVAVLAASSWGSAMSSRLAGIENQQNSLWSSINSIERSVQGSISSITGQVEQALAAEASLFVSTKTAVESFEILPREALDRVTYSDLLEEIDGQLILPEENMSTVTFSMEVTPKTYTPDTRVEFIIDDGAQVLRFEATENVAHRFTALGSCRFADIITISAVIHEGDTSRTEVIDTHISLWSDTFAPITEQGHWMMGLWAESPEELINRGSVDIIIGFGESYFADKVHVATAAVKCYINYAYIDDAPVVSVPMTYTEQWPIPDGAPEPDEAAYYYTAELPLDFASELKEGDTLIVEIQAMDNYYRNYRAMTVHYKLSDGRLDMLGSMIS